METNSPNAADYDALLRIVRTWPAPQRFRFVQAILATLAAEGMAPSQSQSALPQATGLSAKTDQLAPSADEIVTWLEERRQARFGL